MKKIILVISFLILFPSAVNASQTIETSENHVNNQSGHQANDGYENQVQHEAVGEEANTIEPPDWGDDEFESSFSGTGEPSFGADGDEAD